MLKKLFALTLVAGLSGCATLPTEIDIKSGPELVAQEQVEFSYYTPSGPSEDASAQEIVSGFLAAGTGPQNDYAVARQFLTAEFAQRWNPESGAIIRTGAPVFQAAGSELQIVDIGVSARLDDQGRYQDAELGERVSLRFQLVQQDGQWRISSAPNLTVVTQPVFSVVFNAFPVYFLDASRSTLVPDLRWFPSKASTGTKLVNALLAGPSDWLSSAVTSAIPAGTKLTIDAVNVVAGVAKVDFDSTALEADPLSRRLFLSQLRATLLQLPGVVDVAVSINNSEQDIIPSQLQSPSSGGQVYFATEAGVFKVSGAETVPISGTSQFGANNQIQAFTIKSAGDLVAIAGEKGVFLIESSGLSRKTTKVIDQVGVSDLFFDDWGFLWVIPKDPKSDISVVSSTGEVKKLAESPELPRLSYRLSPEGTRLAYVFGDDSMSHVQVAGVLRDGQGWPLKLTTPLKVANVLGEAIAVAWQQSSVLRVLEKTTSGLTAVSDYPLTGPRSQLAMPPIPGINLSVGPSGLSTYLLSQGAEIWVLNGTTWRVVRGQAVALSTAH